jgi:hypothetical protein
MTRGKYGRNNGKIAREKQGKYLVCVPDEVATRIVVMKPVF